jgi:hypothetical protein
MKPDWLCLLFLPANSVKIGCGAFPPGWLRF